MDGYHPFGMTPCSRKFEGFALRHSPISSLVLPRGTSSERLVAPILAAMAAMATTAAVSSASPRFLSPSTARLIPNSVPSPALFSPLKAHHQTQRSRRSLRVAFSRNVPAERKSVTTTPAEPEMTPAELKAYEETCANLEGLTPDFWEGEKWNVLGFVVQYMWAFGVVLSIIACLVAVRSYNFGATDFKDTEVFKEAIEFQADRAEGSGASPFEEAP